MKIDMTEEDKQLLIKDLCARLSYGIIYHRNDGANIKLKEIDINRGYLNYTDDIEKRELKPYLRPMSSMTDKDIHSLFNTMYPNLSMMWYEKETDLIRFRAADYNNKRFLHITLWFNKVYSLEQIDWLNAHHFDYRDLIEKGLALEAPEDMYKKV